MDEAKKDLEDFKANMAYEAALAELEAQKKTINERYDDCLLYTSHGSLKTQRMGPPTAQTI